MAEGIDIRSVWKNSKEKTVASQVNVTEGRKTRTTLYWVKFILWIEFWLSLVSVGPMTYYFITDAQYNLAVFYAALTAVYLLYYQFLIRKISNFHYDENVVKSLRSIYGYLRFYVLHYKVLIWLSLLVGIVIALYDPKNANLIEAFDTTKKWAIFIGILAVFALLFGGILHGLIQLIYGRKIKRIRKAINDFQSQE